nr:hypothetical protein [Tanacetum cinerariifolium]
MMNNKCVLAAVNNKRDSVSPSPLARKPKKGKFQNVTSTLPKSLGPEASGALSKKKKIPKSKKSPTKTMVTLPKPAKGSEQSHSEREEDILGAGEEMDDNPQFAKNHHRSSPPQEDKPTSSTAPHTVASDTNSSSERKPKKGQNRIKTGQKREAWRSQEKFKAVAVGRAGKTEQNAKRMVKNANAIKSYSSLKE